MYKKLHHIISFRLNRMKKRFFNSKVFFKLKFRILLPLGFYDKLYLNKPLEKVWEERIQDVVSSPDNLHIQRQLNAGQVKNGRQVMHNGILITVGGYYGAPITEMLYRNKGVHEPQEEVAFAQVLTTIPKGGTMIELGAYWSFYSIWFNKSISAANNFMVEPELSNLWYGINNFRINNVSGTFTNSFVGKYSGFIENKPVINIDDYVEEKKISFIDILHSDIQGYELEMLSGAGNTIAQNKIGYIFISTHGNKVHYECLNFLESNKFQILCSADEFDTYSLDGLIVAKSTHYKGIDKIDISLKTKDNLHNV